MKNSNIITSVIVPAFNEEEIIYKQIESFILEWRDLRLGSIEVVIVENGSVDFTWREVKRLSEKYREVIGIQNKRSSYGSALKRGLLAARGTYIVCIDVDYFDFQYIQASLKWLRRSLGFVVGSKLHPDSIDSRGVGRLLTTKLLNRIIRYFFNYPGTDTHGLKSFRNTPLLHTCVRRCVSRDELFDTELLIRLEREGVNGKELPVQVQEIRSSRKPLFKRSWRALFDFGRIMLSQMTNGLSSKGVIPLVADDYGWDEYHDRIMLRELRCEKNPTVSVLANMISSSSLQLLKNFAISHSSLISLHFNLIEGKPLSKPQSISSLVKRNGMFYSFPEFYWRILFRRIKMYDIESELNAQFEYLHSHFSIAHIDSHQHVHLLYPVNLMLLKFVKKEKLIVRIRSYWTSINYLVRKPFKCIALVFLVNLSFIFNKLLFRIKPFSDHYFQDELVFHPGFSYDE